MKLIDLEIKNIRGIPDLHIKPNGKSFVIRGPNGSGKSAVIDSIDFLLTGKISRLIGRGTRDICLSEHGPHIDHKPKDAIVRGTIKVHDYKNAIDLERSMSNPKVLKCKKEDFKYIKPIIDIASIGQNVLTRREILKFITSEPSTRAQEIQGLLNISNIEEIRKTFVSLINQFENTLKASESLLNRYQASLLNCLGITDYNDEVIINKINEYRNSLSGKEITELSSTNIKKDIYPPKTNNLQPSININVLEKNIQSISNLLTEENQEKIHNADSNLRKLVNKITIDKEILKALNHKKLIDLGVELVDETGRCPLCDHPWPPGKLIKYLNKKLSTSENAENDQKNIKKYSSIIEKEVDSIIARISKIIEDLKVIKCNDKIQTLQDWTENLNSLKNTLNEPIDKYLNNELDIDNVKKLFAPININDFLNTILLEAKKTPPKISKEQHSWDILNSVKDIIKSIEITRLEIEENKLFYERAKILLTNFQKSRDFVLNNLYQNISNKFETLYKAIHGKDEENFQSDIIPNKAGLNFKVDFYGRGSFPPNALHSEGHQDSMGLCLFLSLFERLTKGKIDLIILDDVVMSVDNQHRKSLCFLFSNFYSNRQFFITTHDKTWAYQLLNEGIVKKNNLIEFCNWEINTGPSINYGTVIWDKIEKDLEKDDIPSAAAKLRHGLEEFFSHVCDSLSVNIKFRLDGKYELGDFIFPAMSKYKDLLKRAITSAKSWDKNDKLEKLEEIESIRKSIYKRISGEQWGINVNVHYNTWVNMGKEDFQSIYHAFQDLCELFICPQCKSMMKLSIDGNKEKNTFCNCGERAWTLLGKS